MPTVHNCSLCGHFPCGCPGVAKYPWNHLNDLPSVESIRGRRHIDHETLWWSTFAAVWASVGVVIGLDRNAFNQINEADSIRDSWSSRAERAEESETIWRRRALQAEADCEALCDQLNGILNFGMDSDVLETARVRMSENNGLTKRVKELEQDRDTWRERAERAEAEDRINYGHKVDCTLFANGDWSCANNCSYYLYSQRISERLTKAGQERDAAIARAEKAEKENRECDKLSDELARELDIAVDDAVEARRERDEARRERDESRIRFGKLTESSLNHVRSIANQRDEYLVKYEAATKRAEQAEKERDENLLVSNDVTCIEIDRPGCGVCSTCKSVELEAATKRAEQAERERDEAQRVSDGKSQAIAQLEQLAESSIDRCDAATKRANEAEAREAVMREILERTRSALSVWSFTGTPLFQKIVDVLSNPSPAAEALLEVVEATSAFNKTFLEFDRNIEFTRVSEDHEYGVYEVSGKYVCELEYKAGVLRAARAKLDAARGK